MCQTLLRTKEIPWLCRGKTGCAGSLLLAPLSLCLGLWSQVRDLQGSSPAKGRSEPGLGRWWPRFLFARCSPSGRCLGSGAAGEDGAGTQKQLPDLSFPELKGAVVPFAEGEAGGQAGFVCVQLSQLPAAQGAQLLPKILGDSASLFCAVASTDSVGPISCLGPQSSPAAPFTPQKIPHEHLDVVKAGGGAGGASLGAEPQRDLLASSTAGDGGNGFTGWLQEPAWKTGGIWRLPNPEDSSSCRFAHSKDGNLQLA